MPEECYTYKGRQKALAQLGFESYAQYLASSRWTELRSQVLVYFGWKCFCCGGRATQVHHQRYHKNDLTGKRRKYLKAICGTCHDAIEFSWIERKKGNLQQANSKLEHLIETGVMKRARITGEELDAEIGRAHV